MYFNSIYLTCILLPNDWSKDYLIQGIPCLVHLIVTWTGPSPAVQVDLVQGIHLRTPSRGTLQSLDLTRDANLEVVCLKDFLSPIFSIHSLQQSRQYKKQYNNT